MEKLGMALCIAIVSVFALIIGTIAIAIAVAIMWALLQIV